MTRVRLATGAENSVDVLSASALELARSIRERHVSAREVVDAHIARIEQVNPTINAVIADRFDAARAEADAADARIARGEAAPPLLGVPFTAKEMIECDGMPHTFGCTTRRGVVARRDATVVARLRAAGAIPLGATNVPEWGMWYETHNLIYGLTRNPHDPSRTAGGSSGGEAAIIGAGGSPFGLGSDIGGSIRMPAAFCGVYGHKPTPGLVPLTGHYPVYPDGSVPKRTNRWVTVGPLARSAGDLMALMRIITGPDGLDPNVRDDIVLRDEPVDWRGRQVFVLEHPAIARAGRPAAEVAAATRRAADHFASLGADVRPFRGDFFRDTVDLWFAALQSIGAPTLGVLAGGDTPIAPFRELLRALTGRQRFSWPVLGFVAMESLKRGSPARLQSMIEHIERLQGEFSRIVGDDGILLMPPHPRTAPPHHVALLHPFSFAYTAALNVLRVPATVAPMGFDSKGLPLSVQIAAAPGNDHLTIAGAAALPSPSPICDMRPR